MSQQFTKPSVLAVTRHSAFLRDLRLEMPLLNLKKQGLIQDYFITDPSLFDVPDDFRFDVVWLQRANDPRLLDQIRRTVGNHYLYDFDDLLLARSSYRDEEVPNRNVIIEGIRQCQVVTVTSLRLARLAEKYCGCSIQERTTVCPNAYEFHDWVRVPHVPSGIIITSSEELPIMQSADAIMASIVDFCGRHDLPMMVFGRLDSRLAKQIRGMQRVTTFGNVSYWHYHQLLAAFPPMIGIAALETHGDPETLDFVNGKSDIKMVDFGGFGHPSVYSAAPPYTDSDLKAGQLVENTYEAWTEGLEVVYDDGWQRLAAEQQAIIRQRAMDRIAEECWFPALKKAQLPELIPGKEIQFQKGRLGFYAGAIKHMAFSQDYGSRKRIMERVPRPLMAIMRRFLLDT